MAKAQMTCPTLYPAFAEFSQSQIETNLFAHASKVFPSSASGAQVQYIAALCVRNEKSRTVYQWLITQTSGGLTGKRASKMIDTLLAIN